MGAYKGDSCKVIYYVHLKFRVRLGNPESEFPRNKLFHSRILIDSVSSVTAEETDSAVEWVENEENPQK